MIRLLRHAAQLALLVLVVPALVSAEVSRVEVASRRDLAGGRSFGSSGSYEQITGRLYFLVDPASKRNQVIADLDKAPKNAAGKIEMSADLVILKPREPSRGNGIALFDIVNRGGGVALGAFDGPAVANTPNGEVGDGFLLNRGYTIVRVGWEFDARRDGAVRIDLPAAVGVTGVVRATFIPNNRNATTVGDLVGYTPSDPASPQNTLRVRDSLGADWVTVPRTAWHLAGNTVTVDAGFESGHTYELAYVAVNPPVAGLGFAAVRDAAAWVKYVADATVSAKYTFAYGSSQTSRKQSTAGQSVRPQAVAASAARRHGEMGARGSCAAAESISPFAGRHPRARRRRGVSEHQWCHFASNGPCGDSGSEPSAAARWRGHAAAVSGPAGGPRRERSQRPSASNI